MARVVKRAEERQDEILDVAQRLFMARGYADTAVQEIIDEIGIAKGTFYHHYPSKSVLLDALVMRLVHQSMAITRPIVADPELGAIDKLNGLYLQVGRWKSDRRDALIELARAMYSDANTLMMRRIEQQSGAVFVPLLAEVLAQGVAEGVFDTPTPDYAAHIVYRIGLALFASLRAALIDEQAPIPSLAEATAEIDAFHDAVERVLGAPRGTIRLIDPEDIGRWLDAAAAGRCS